MNPKFTLYQTAFTSMSVLQSGPTVAFDCAKFLGNKNRLTRQAAHGASFGGADTRVSIFQFPPANSAARLLADVPVNNSAR